MAKDDATDHPEETADDVLYRAAKAGLVGFSPVGAAGAVAFELISCVIQSPFERRNRQYVQELDYRLNWLEHRIDRFSPQNLSKNDAFVSTVLQTIRAAGVTHRQEKREALRNVVLNTALGRAPDDDIRELFIGMVDQFTVLHIEALTILHEAEDRVPRDESGRPAKKQGGSLAGFARWLVGRRYPHGVVETVCQELFNRGLLTREPIGFTGNPGSASWTSPLGKQFIAFIREPEEFRDYEG